MSQIKQPIDRETHSRSAPPWRPLLVGAQAEPAHAAVSALVADLADPTQLAPSGLLADGHAGIALLYAYLDRCGRSGVAEQAGQLLDHAAAAIANRPVSASLYSGFTGVAWAIAHIQPAAWELEGPDDPLAEIDAALLELVSRSSWPHDYDLISGLVGFGVYALERLPQPCARACLEQIVLRLAEIAERQPEGTTWLTSPHLLIALTRATYPNGYYNLGLAHGVPGVIALLGAICAAGIAAAVARPLLNSSVAWLLAQRLPPGHSSWFGYYTGFNIAPTSSRLAWCYGDLGLAAALLAAARFVAEPAWELAALSIARAAAAREVHGSGVIDAGLCHGGAGVAHLFNRIYQASGEPIFAEAARRWFTHTLTLREPGQGIGGFLAYEPGSNRSMDWVASPGFLSGAAGIGLALLAATSAIEPAWDRALLTAIPPQRRPEQGSPAFPHTRANPYGEPERIHR